MYVRRHTTFDIHRNCSRETKRNNTFVKLLEMMQYYFHHAVKIGLSSTFRAVEIIYFKSAAHDAYFPAELES